MMTVIRSSGVPSGHPLIARRDPLVDQRPPRGILVVREEVFSMSSGIIVRLKKVHGAGLPVFLWLLQQ